MQAPLLLAGLIVAWRTRLRWVFVTVFGLGAALLGVQRFTHDRTLALLFPWRVSVILVPVAFVLTVSALAGPLWRRRTSAAVVACAVVLAAAAASCGWVRTRRAADAYARAPGVAMMQAASRLARPGTLFVVPKDLQRFRLETGAATFVDYKSHPYRADEVAAWYARLALADALDAGDGPAACRTVATLRARYGATHFVRPAARPLACPGLVPVFEDRDYLIFAATPEGHATCSGSSTVNVAPAPGALSTATVPPSASTSSFTTHSPTPKPL